MLFQCTHEPKLIAELVTEESCINGRGSGAIDKALSLEIPSVQPETALYQRFYVLCACSLVCFMLAWRYACLPMVLLLLQYRMWFLVGHY